jgi:hypothetical protein
MEKAWLSYEEEADLLDPDEESEDETYILTEHELAFAASFHSSSLLSHDTDVSLYLVGVVLDYVSFACNFSQSTHYHLTMASALLSLIEMDEPWEADTMKDFLTLTASVFSFFEGTLSESLIPPKTLRKAAKIRREIAVLVLDKTRVWDTTYRAPFAPPLFDRDTFYFDPRPSTSPHPLVQRDELSTAAEVPPGVQQQQDTSTEGSQSSIAAETPHRAQQQQDKADKEVLTSTPETDKAPRDNLHKLTDVPKTGVRGSNNSEVKISPSSPSLYPIRMCSSCSLMKGKDAFATRQWTSPSRKCKTCTGAIKKE